jgi:hypothetical protein
MHEYAKSFHFSLSFVGGILFSMRKTVAMFCEIAVAGAFGIWFRRSDLAVTASIGLALGALLGRYDGDVVIYPIATLLVILAFRGVIVTMIDRWSLVLVAFHWIWYAFLVLLAHFPCPTNHQLPFLTD